MKAFKIVLIVLFLALSAVEIYAAITGQSAIKFISTPLLMPLLGAFYLVAARRRSWLIIVALALSLVGDVLNQWQSNPDILMIETGAFLLALVCYTAALLKPLSHLGKVPPAIYLLAVAYVAYGVLLYVALRPYLGEMEVPSIVYVVVVLLMSFSALTRIGSSSGLSLWLPLVGSLFFVASDTFIAFNVFKYDGQMSYGDFLTTIFYIPAQVLIVLGFVTREGGVLAKQAPSPA